MTRLKTPKNLMAERCTCGQLRGAHGDGLAGGKGHGPCDASDCPQFTWAEAPAGGYQFRHCLNGCGKQVHDNTSFCTPGCETEYVRRA